MHKVAQYCKNAFNINSMLLHVVHFLRLKVTLKYFGAYTFYQRYPWLEISKTLLYSK